MRVAVIGAGAIGAVVAEAAARSGHDVTVCARTPIDSLVLERDGQVHTLPVAITSQTSDLSGGPVDMVFLTVKATDTAQDRAVVGPTLRPRHPGRLRSERPGS